MALINALTTLANVKLITGITSNTTDATLELLINRASAKVRNYLGRTLKRDTYTEVISPTARQGLLVKEFPIISITSIKSSNVDLVLNTDYRLDSQDKEKGSIYRQVGWEPINLVSGLTMDIMATARTIDVIYVAGYYLPADSGYVAGASDSLPMDIQGVVDELVSESYMKIRTHAQGLTNYSEGNISFGWDKKQGATAFGFSEEHAQILNNYKRWVVA